MTGSQTAATMGAAARLERTLPRVLKSLFEGASDPLATLSIAQVRIVRTLEESPCTVTELAEVHRLTQSAISQQLKSLLARNLVEVETSAQDRRVKRLHLSARGQDLMQQRAIARRQAAARLLSRMPVHQVDSLIEALEVIAHLGESEPNA